ncbi:MAG TPA: hypothetical protein VLH77_05490 [Gammaproteobacteria bacterium]|nr:hypothetical protein [Gammaproteobacteria bacterium]
MPVSLRSFTNFILKSRFRTIGIAFVVSFIQFIGPTLGIILAALVTLSQDALDGFWVFIAATLPCLLLLPVVPLPDGLWVLGLIVASNFLTWGFAVLLKRTDSWSIVLELTTLIGLIIVLTAHLANPKLEVWWEKQLNTHVSQIFPNLEAPSSASSLLVKDKENTNHEATEALEPEIISFVNTIKPYVTGVLTASFLFNVLLQLFVSRWWQLALLDPKRLKEELHKIRFTTVAGLVFMATLFLSYLKIALALDLLPVLYLTFSLAGLSLVHYTANKFKGLTSLFLVVFYLVLIGTWVAYKIPLIFQLLALAALLDIWLDWRGRLNKRFSH